jgi:hypothetical protein
MFNNKLKSLHEPWITFSILVELPDGGSMSTKEKGRTHWEALDRAYTKHMCVQKSREKYMLSSSL